MKKEKLERKERNYSKSICLINKFDNYSIISTNLNLEGEANSLCLKIKHLLLIQ